MAEFETETIQGEEYERADYTSRSGPSTMGRSIVYITCGFCGQQVTAYLWSLNGSGKKCPCGAKHNGYGFSTRKKIIEEIPHSDYPHEPGRLHGCLACESKCYCTGDPGHTECVFEGEHCTPKDAVRC